MAAYELESKFFEDYPLYRDFPINFDPQPGSGDTVNMPRLSMFCENCGNMRTFICLESHYQHRESISINFSKINECRYQCTHCEKFRRYFSILFNAYKVMKVGQYPPWDITINRDFLKLLGDYKDNYKKGVICESQGYGIGAYAYYRRIIESIIDKLLNSITDLILEEEKEEYKEALEKAKKEIIAAKKIELVKDLLPSSLRPAGINPLDILYNILSRGIHKETDAECLELAEQIRKSLIRLVIDMTSQKESQKEFTDTMRKILNKRK